MALARLHYRIVGELWGHISSLGRHLVGFRLRLYRYRQQWLPRRWALRVKHKWGVLIQKRKAKGMVEMLTSPPFLLFIGAILSGVGAFWAASQQAQFERELRTKSETIAALTTEALQTVTGGDSFAYLSSSVNARSNRITLTVIHEGKYPLYDLVAQIVDLQTVPDSDGKTRLHVGARQRRPIGTLIPNHAETLGEIPLGDTNERDFNVFFTARNGGWNQEVRLRRVGKHWYKAIRVTRGRNYEVIFEESDTAYPQSESGGLVGLPTIPPNASENPYFGLPGEGRMFHPTRRM